MNDFQVYPIARQRMDQLHAEAMALDHGPGVPRRLADSLRALADWTRIPGLLRRLTPISPRPDTPCTASSTPARTSRWRETCFVPVRSAKEPDMPSVHRTRVRYRGSAAIAAAAVFTVFAVAGSGPAWAQAPAPPSPEETWGMMGADSEVSPSRQGYVLDNGEFTVSGQLEQLAVQGERLALACQRFAQDRTDSC